MLREGAKRGIGYLDNRLACRALVGISGFVSPQRGTSSRPTATATMSPLIEAVITSGIRSALSLDP